MVKRVTRQRKAILHCLSQEARALTMDEIFTSVAPDIPKLNRSTIYRTIKTLIDEGRVKVIEFPGKRLCYEMCRAEHHHYFLCDRCRKSYQIDRCPQGLLEMVPKGFVLLGHSIVLSGLCLPCQGHNVAYTELA